MERLQESLHFIGATASNQHTVFVDDAAAARDFDAAAHFDTPAELLGRTFNRPRTAQLEAGEAAEGIDQLPKGLDRFETLYINSSDVLQSYLLELREVVGDIGRVAMDQEGL